MLINFIMHRSISPSMMSGKSFCFSCCMVIIVSANVLSIYALLTLNVSDFCATFSQTYIKLMFLMLQVEVCMPVR